MDQQAKIRAALEAAIFGAIKELGVSSLKATSMSPLNRLARDTRQAA